MKQHLCTTDGLLGIRIATFCSYHQGMGEVRNIIIGDESAVHALMRRDWAEHDGFRLRVNDPLEFCAQLLSELSAFNADNPLYGPKPVKLLIPHGAMRRSSEHIVCRYAPDNLPDGSFFRIREGLFMVSPELAYARMAEFASEMQLAAIGTDLCGCYYIDERSGDLPKRSGFLTSPEKLRSFCEGVPAVRGAKKALRALRWVLPNSASPAETKAMLLFTTPLCKGGFGLPFTHMNFDIRPKHARRLADQDSFCVDIANPNRKIAIEYDGEDYHEDAGKDKRRRNQIAAFGWSVLPVDKEVLNDANSCRKFGLLVAKKLGVRLRISASWTEKNRALRAELGLYSC